jgi:hypothetical protein
MGKTLKLTPENNSLNKQTKMPQPHGKRVDMF